MKRSKWTPVLRFWDLKREIDEAFDNLIDEPWGRTARAQWLPAVDIDETPDAYIVTIDLPGVCADDVELRIHPWEIEIRGTRTTTRSVESARRILTERSVGRFHRKFKLEHAVDPNTAESECKDGLYRLEVKKRSRREE